MAVAAGLADVAPVLCEVLRSDTRPPRLDHIADALARLLHDDAADLPAARHCLRAMATTAPTAGST
ncbi:hypothetical protein AB0M46_40695 [Dactylosporangium sp. NPDC051485]|uniref:hypothetical protein n=1 Tax=Dactylosporangium sp. NPDC051485 TaxID=3154846 RepID=UPI00341646E7